MILASVFVALLLSLLASLAQAQEEAPLAVLMSVRGPVNVVSTDGSTRLASFGMHLHPGDEVQTGEDASAEILFSSGNLVEIGPQSQTSVGRQRPAGQESSKSFQSVQNFLKLRESRGTSSISALRSGGPREELWLRHPCQSRVSSRELVFSWKAKGAPPEVKFTLYGKDGAVFETTVKNSTEFHYPSKAPPLDPGITYSWTVETADPFVIPPLRSPAGFFEVLNEEENARVLTELSLIEGDEAASGRHLYRASVYYQHGMLDDAVDEASSALEEDPKNNDLRGILARLLSEAGRSSEAISEYDRILAPR